MDSLFVRTVGDDFVAVMLQHVRIAFEVQGIRLDEQDSARVMDRAERP